MEATKPLYSLIKQIKDDKFDVDHLDNYKLTLHIGNEEFQISIFDVNKKCLLIEDYELNEIKSTDDIIDILSGIVESHHLLKAGFWKEIKVSFKNKKYTLIPESLFEEAHAHEYLQQVSEVDPISEEVHYFVHEKRGFVIVFAAETKIVNWLKALYPSIPISFIHQGSVLIEGIFNYDDHPSSEGVFIYKSRKGLHIMVTSRKQLQYYNHFSCSSPEEFTRYILVVFQELRLNPNLITVILWGDFDKGSTYFQNLYRYIRHVNFANKPSFLKLAFQFDELHDHEYLDLYSINLC